MMNRRWGFWAVFLGGPASGLMGAFVLGVLVVSLLSNLCYDLLAGALVQWQTVLPTLAISGAMTLVAYILYRRTQGRVSVGIAVDESQQAPARAGLIWLLGPHYDHLLTALRHHCQGGGGEHCWLVLQDSPAMQDTFQRCAAALVAAELTTRLYPVYLRRLDAQSAYRAVREILEREVVEAGLTADEVIADITSGTKPLTAGMVLAALTCGGALEYVQSRRDAAGQVIDGTQQVVLLDMDFYLTAAQTASES
jgi:hypothetical protein